MKVPGYWRSETSGVLRPVVEAYLNHQPMTPLAIAALRAYCRQWIMADVWDAAPGLDDQGKAWLAEMRAAVDTLTDRSAIDGWVSRAIDGGLDPL